MARILVIDDDPNIRALLYDALLTAGHTVLLAEDGGAGLKLQARSPADLVITDIYMPDKEGLEVIRTLRTYRPRVPVIAISGRPYLMSALFLAQRLGAVHTLEKPFGARELLAAVDSALQTQDIQPYPPWRWRRASRRPATPRPTPRFRRSLPD